MHSTTIPPDIIKMLAHDLRWQVVQLLAVGDLRVGELVERVGHPLNLVSYHLKQLRDTEIVTARRSDADGRDTYYSLDLDRLRHMFHAAGAAIHPVLTESNPAIELSGTLPTVLFICTHNSARSQMAEGLLRHLSDGKIQVESAGSHPTTIHPNAIRVMTAMNIDMSGQYSKDFDTVLDRSFDLIITVCDLAREVCPTFPGNGTHIHWGFSDPAVFQDDSERQQAFEETAKRLKARIEHFLHGLNEG